ncbi:MAG: DoxX family protein [Alphaproteobacteria bacterium]|nr:DoxX family protein [Alphaproteobacteria bacterium]
MDRIDTPALPALGRLLMAWFMVSAGWGKLMAASATIGFIASAGLPFPTLAYIVALVVEIGVGLLLLVGLFTGPVGIVLALWCLITALIFHGNQIMFHKNPALPGGFLFVAALGAGAWSVDAMLARRRAAAAPA